MEDCKHGKPPGTGCWNCAAAEIARLEREIEDLEEIVGVYRSHPVSTNAQLHALWSTVKRAAAAREWA